MLCESSHLSLIALLLALKPASKAGRYNYLCQVSDCHWMKVPLICNSALHSSAYMLWLAACVLQCNSIQQRATYPGEQSFPLGNMVNELEGSGGAVDATVHVTIEVQQSHLLLLTAVRCLHLWAAHTRNCQSKPRRQKKTLTLTATQRQRTCSC